MAKRSIQEQLQQLQFFQAFFRGLRGRCPVCGQGSTFQTWFRMHSACEDCEYSFERPPGFFLGSTYINYGITALTCTLCFVILRFGFGWPRNTLLALLLPFCLIFPLVFFRFARSLWLSLDCWFDRVGAAESLAANSDANDDVEQN